MTDQASHTSQTDSDLAAEASDQGPTLTIGRADYAERRQRRLERLRARANKLTTSGHARLGLARNTARLIPFGQPILVGHHSERRHRRDLKRIEEGHSRGFADLEKAETLARRAANAERNDAVSSDDPAALTKLRGEVEKLTLAHARWRAINTALRSKKPGKLEALELTHDERRTIELSQGWTSYKTTNLAANIRRVKARIQVLEAQAQRGEVPDVSIGDIVLREQDNRMQLIFPSKPDEPTRRMLKSDGFRWAPSVGAWQRHASPQARRRAEYIAQQASR